MITFYKIRTKRRCWKLAIFFLVALIQTSFGQALFNQPFNAGNPITKYVSLTPTVNKLTAIAVSSGTTASAVSGTSLEFTRTSGSGTFSRVSSTPLFSPIPTTLKYSFDIKATCTASTQNVAQFKLGDGFSNANTSETNPNTYGRIGIDFVASNKFQLRNLSNATVTNNAHPGPFNTASGSCKVTWYLNNSGTNIYYENPNGGYDFLSNDNMDVWIDSAGTKFKVFSQIATTTPGLSDMTEMKFVFNAGLGKIGISNVVLERAVPTIACPSPFSQTFSTDPGDCSKNVTTLVPPTIALGTTCLPLTITNDYNGTSSANDIYAVGTNLITWQVVDACGNATNCTQQIIVEDHQAPVFDCRANQTRLTTLGQCSYSVDAGEFDMDTLVYDNCLLNSLTCQLTGATTGSSYTTLQGVNFNTGITTVTWTAVDWENNTSTCSFNVTVSDGENPSITCASGNVNRNTDLNVCNYTIVGNEFNASATDYCGVSSLKCTISGATNISNLTTSSLPGTVLNKGANTITWTAKDAANNTTTCSFIVTVIDAQPAVITCVGNQNVNANSNGCKFSPSGGQFNPTSLSDNCAYTLSYTLAGATNASQTFVSSLNGVLFNLGTTTVTWTIDDGSTTPTTCSFDVVVGNNNLSATATNNGPINTGGTITFNSVATGGNNTYSYAWTGPNSLTGTGSPYVLNAATFAATGMWTVLVTDGYGCTASNSTDAIVYNNLLYVNDNSSVGDSYTSALGNNANSGSPTAPLRDIQFAVNIAAPGDIIYVDAGTYSENPIVNKQVTILGPNNNINPCSGSRVAEAILRTAVSGPTWNDPTNQILTIAANGVILKGLTFEGNNSTLGTGIQIAEAIYVSQANSDLNFQNNIFQNLYQAGIDASNGINTVSINNQFKNNKFENIPGNTNDPNGQFGIAVLVYNNLYAQIDNNCMNSVRIGVQTGNGNQANTGNPASISGNTINATRLGIFHNLHYSSASPYDISGNTIGMSVGAKGGIMISSIQGTTGVICSGNQISGGNAGYNLWNNPTSNTVSISGGIISNCTYGIFANNYDGYSSNAASSAYNVFATIINNSVDNAIYVKDNSLNTNGATVSVNIQSNTTINNSSRGLVLEGAGASATFNGNQVTFTGQSRYIDQVSNGIDKPTTAIDATNVTFDGQTGATATLAQNFAIEDKINHKVDDSALGLVSVKATNLFVTTNSFITPATTSALIQRGVDAASNGFTVNVNSGSYTEDVNVNKSVSVLGAGYATTTVSGPIGGAGATFAIASGNVLLDGFSITRDGNNVAQWNLALNTAGISIQSQGNYAEVRNCNIYGNRSGIDINNSNGNNIHNNIINNNRTGLIFRNQTDNTNVSENFITNNWTAGVLFLDGSGGTNSPTQTAANSTFNNNNISGNWYGDIVDRQSGGSLPAPGTNLKNFECNWYGTTSQPTTSTANSTEPGYAAQVPVVYGGTAVAPGGQPKILGPASANIDYISWLVNGTDNSGNSGFQPTGGVCSGTPVILSETHVNVDCNGNSTGSVNLNVSGGTTPYAYSWSNGTTTEDLTGVAAGTYTVTVTDVNGSTATLVASITQPATLAATGTQVNVLCYGNSTGSIDLTVTGGTTGYTYLWSNNATTQDISGLAAGTYSVTVTDANSCTTTASFTIGQPVAALAATGTQVNVLCYGNSTGSIDLTVTGGTSAYTYLWSNTATTQDISGLAAGTYSVTVTDANSCTTTASFTIGQPVAALAATGTQVNVLCYGNSTGSIDLTVTGGTTGYTYLWSNTATTQDISGLAAGTYSVTVTDANSCTTTASFTIGQPAAALAATGTQVNVLCFGNSTGSIDLTVTGGTTGYTYLWSNTATTQDISGLAAGTYSVTVTDANSCTTTASFTIGQPAAALAATGTQVDVLCFGNSTGSIDLTVTGGTTGYTYLWSNNATTQDISGLAAGTYSVTVTDANSCTTTASFTIGQPAAALAATGTQVNVLCFGNSTGSIDLTVTGGTTGYTYLWSNTATTQDISGLAAGTYSVTVTDANNCTTTASFTINQPNQLVASASNNGPKHTGETISFSSSEVGGTSGYTYSWVGPNGFTSAIRNPSISNVTSAANGVYTVTVLDANGCTATAQTTPLIYGDSLYVNDLNSAGDVYTTGLGNNANPGTTSQPFATISHAVSIATANTLIFVDAGTYTEFVTVNKALEIRGSNYGINPCSPGRAAEAILLPPSSSVLTNVNGTTSLISITSDNVKIDGLTIDGDNTLANSLYSANGANPDVDYGIASEAPTAGDNIHIINNIIKNVFQFGVVLGNTGSSPAKNGLVSNNKIDNIPYWAGVVVYDDYYAQIDNNCMNNVWLGVQTNNFYKPTTGVASISNNTIITQTQVITNDATYTSVGGILLNLQYQNAANWNVNNNTITNTSTGGANSIGINIWSAQNSAGFNITGNNITGFDKGYSLWNCPTTNNITLNGGNVTNCNTGVYATNNDVYGDAPTSNYAINGINIQSSSVAGVVVNDDFSNASNGAVSVSIGGATTINNSSTGLKLIGGDASASFTGSQVAFTGQSIYIDQVTNGINKPNTNINATGVSFNTQTGATASLAQNFAIEDKINHQVDEPALGLVTVRALNTYVTPNSFIAPATTSAKIQRGINSASNGFTVNVNSGSYNEQVSVNKQVALLGAAVKPSVSFSGTVSGKPTLFDVSEANVSISNFNMQVDLTKLNSGIIASATNISNLAIANNDITAVGSSAAASFGSYGNRNAISINYSGSINYRIAVGGVNNVQVTGNTVGGLLNDGFGQARFFRSAVSTDESGGSFTGNTFQSINHDIAARFGSNGNITISGNNFNGGGVELSDMNAGAGVLTVSNNIFNATFANTAAPGTAVLRLKNNYNFKTTAVTGNTFSNHQWAISQENYNTVTLDNNNFTPLAGSTTYHHVAINTKSISSNSNTILQVQSNGVLTNNTFNGSGAAGGTAISFHNHDNDAASFGTYTVGSAGNANIFNAGIGTFVRLDDQTGTSTGSTFPIYPGTGGWPTTMACWTPDINVQENTFDVGAGLQSPSAMNFTQRTALENALYHKVDNACAGNIIYFIPVHNLTQNTYYSTIQAAVNAASANNVIECAEWTYNERVTIDKSLTLQGVDSANCVLTGTGLAGNGNGITINNGITNVNISKLNIRNFTGANGNSNGGIYAIGGNNNLSIDEVSVRNNTNGSGFYANGPVSNVSITDSRFANSGPGARGIVIWNGLKSNITFNNNWLSNNQCCGIELQDGDASAVTVTNNMIDVGNGDNAIGLVGLNPSIGANLVDGNTISGGGRFGIEIKNPAGGVTISNNNVSLTTINADQRDRAGVAIFRRGVSGNNVDVPNGVTVTGNTVSGYTQASADEGFGIVIEGTNHTVSGNTVTNCEVGIQQQGGAHPNSGYPGDGNQNAGSSANYFGRGNSPLACGNTISSNTFSGNGTDTRNVIGGGIYGLVTNTNTGEYFCNIQAAIDDAQTLNGHTLNVQAATHPGSVNITKSLTINGANTGVSACGTRSAETVIQNGAFDLAANGITINGFEFTGTGAQIRSNTALATWSNINILNNRIHTTTASQPILHAFGFGGGVGTTNWTIKGNKIDNILAANATAIAIFNISGVTITNNCIQHANASFIGRRGINADGLQNANIDDNTIDLGDVVPSEVVNQPSPWAVQISMSDRIASNINIRRNTISGAYRGIMTLSQRSVSSLNIERNIIGPVSVGIDLNTGGATPLVALPVQSAINVYQNIITTITPDVGGIGSSLRLRNLHSAHANGPVSFSGVTVNENNFITPPADSAIRVESGLALSSSNATCNWYGSVSGTVVAAKVSAAINASPWLINGTDNDGVTMGFQPVPASCLGSFITLSANQVNVNCNGNSNGSIDLSVSGSTAPYTYSWSNGASSEDISGLAAGAYTVNVTDTYGTGATLIVTITQPILVTVSASATNVSCNGLANGTITASSSAGSTITVNGSPYNASATYGPGTYTIVATAPNGNNNGNCTATTSVTISEPIQVTVSATSTNVSCNGAANGTITASSSAGSTITVNGAAYNASATYGPGTYTIVATAPNGNANGNCTATTSVTITEPIQVTISATSTNVSCNGAANGTITASSSVGSTITVNGSPYNASATYGPGTYTIVATAPNGNNNGNCTATTSVTINEPIQVTISATSTNVSCNGLADGTITATGSAGSTITINGLAPAATYGPGTYTIVATAPNGNANGFCTATTTVEITQPIQVTVSATSTNVSCNGAANGTITATGSAGSTITVNGSPYNASATYGPGTYTIVATAPNGNNNGNCTATTSVTISEPIQVTISATSTNVSCNGAADGTITASSSAGSTITVNGNAYNASATYGPGTYTIVATAPNGNANGFCTATSSVEITQPIAVTVSATSTNVSCFGAANGTITATGSAGSTITVNGSPYNASATYGPGTYTIVATAPNGNANGFCTATTSVEITEPIQVTISATSTNVSCNGAANGTITASSSAGSTITVNGSPYNASATYGPGTYTIVATAPNGNNNGFCTATTSATINEPIQVTINATSTNVSCFGVANGTITATGSAGSTITVNGSPYNASATYGPGTYTIVATAPNGNANGFCTATTSVTINEPIQVTISATSTNVSCNGLADGTITASSSAGSTITVNGSPYNASATYGPGTYTIVATAPNGNNNGNCTATTSVTISEPIQVTVSATSTNVSCNGLADGTITASSSAGSTITVNGNAYNASATYGPGTYTIVATAPNGNANGFCTATTSVAINEPIQVTISATSTNVSCFGAANGTITASSSAGSTITVNGNAYNASATYGPGTYTIVATAPNGNNNGNCTATTSVEITEPIQVTISATSTNVSCNGLANGTITASSSAGSTITVNGNAYNASATYGPGTYTIVATAPNGNANGFCTATTSVEITEPIQVTISATSTNVSCNGLANGTITASSSAGSTITVNGNAYNASATYGPGTYTIVATAPNGNNNGNCTATTSVTINEPIQVTISATSTNVSCFGAANGTITATGSAGSTITVNGSPYNASATYGPGTYTIVATAPNGNANGNCTATTSVTINEPIQVTISATSTNVSCNGLANGTITASSSAGSTITVNGSPYNASATYGPGTYTIVATAPNGNANGNCTATTSVTITQPIAVTVSATSTNVSCNGAANGTITASSSAGSTITVNGNAYNASATYGPGTYTIVATAPNGNNNGNCTATTTLTITQPTALVASSSATTILCNGGSSTVTVGATGGTSPYTGTGTFSRTAGTYTFTVTDANGCTATTTITITQPAALVASASVTSIISCNGGSGVITVSTTGGTMPYIGTGTFTRAAGSYNFTVTDANGCSSSTLIAITQPNALALNVTKTNVNCTGSSTGTATANVTGGTSPYSYSWSNGSSTSAITGLAAGTYTVTVTDANGCSITGSATITQPGTLLNASTSKSNVSCFGGNNGVATVAVSGGITPYVYLWNTGATTASITGLVAGNYTVTVTDNNGTGCSIVRVITITQPTIVGATYTNTPGSLTAIGNGGTSPYTYKWSTGANTATISTTSGTFYTVTVTDSRGCRRVMSPVQAARIASMDAETPFTMNVYPNPTKDQLNVELSADNDDETAIITLHDISGRMIFVENRTLLSGTNKLNLDLSGYANGTYLLTVDKNGSKNVVRVMVAQ